MLPISVFDKNFAFKIKNNNQNINLIGRVKVKVLVVTAIIILVVLATQMVFAASLATDGQKISQIDQEIEKLEIENINLKVQITQQSSFKTLKEKAKTLGFEKN
ncbi:hypothetical protein HYU92_02765 [Candidatus Curtissbacteria bacterium]|nr:hypothetical protein [Candidatus Curtissbacteria bacterium]